MPHGLSGDEYDDLVSRYNDIYADLLEYDGIAQAEDAIADAADAVLDRGDDPYEVLSSLLDEREEAHDAYANGMDVDWDHSDYDEYDFDDAWFYYH